MMDSLDTRTTADERGELFGVHIPELQLPVDEYRSGLRAAGLAAGERYLELGSGHGSGLVLAVTAFDVEQAVGVEYLEDAALRTMHVARKAGVGDRVEVRREDVRQFDPRGFDVVHMHLGPAFHDVLAARLERLLDAQTRVVAAGWRVPGWRPLDDALDMWDGGYVYRPADPHLQLTWNLDDPLMADIHADLYDVQVRINDRPVSSVVAGTDLANPARGQRLRVTVSDAVSAEDAVTIWARARDGRVTQRGAATAIPISGA